MINSLRLLKKIFIVLIILNLLFIIFYNTYATDKIITGARDFLKVGKESPDMLDKKAIKTTSDTIFNVLMVIGFILVLIVGAILGIQFIFGSIEEKAKVQEALIPYIIGSVVIFGATGIWKLVVTVLEANFK